MYIDWLKKSKPEVWEMIQRNPTARSKLKSIELLEVGGALGVHTGPGSLVVGIQEEIKI